nr:immunoglobulin heavy chain junction region [Macaca mulatta]MOX65776.1 immunoglobulin heavy chain junction region [Macaca mulatta]MOX68945.1 immunoglobulin heavy chain junction region [Macaca mulatta]
CARVDSSGWYLPALDVW